MEAAVVNYMGHEDASVRIVTGGLLAITKFASAQGSREVHVIAPESLGSVVTRDGGT